MSLALLVRYIDMQKEQDETIESFAEFADLSMPLFLLMLSSRLEIIGYQLFA
jgi:hypothetical protein